MNHQKMLVGLALAACLFSVAATAQDDAAAAAKPENAFADIAGRWYVSPMYSFTGADKGRQVDDANGGLLAIGKQVNPYLNFELYGFQSVYGAKADGKDGKLTGLGFAAYGSPWARSTDGMGRWLGGAYGLIGVGGRKAKDFPERFGLYNQNRDGYIVDAGLGYLLRLPFIRFASLRLEARYRLDFVTRPFASVDYDEENDEPNFEELVLSAGLLIPIGAPPAPPAPPAAAAVVPVAPVCSDGMDNDGDGQIDFPADKGCSAADDNDEADPAVCADGIDNDGDGLIDFPADKGCTSSDDSDETDPCKTPAPGEKVSLAGCSSGDVIVLRGVNFEFDKSRLTANAKTILDGVTAELVAYPEINIELGGHTDARGSDEYNQRLSEQRAASVLQYLRSQGIASERMASAGYGEAQPVADNETEAGRELNRRVELKITSGSPPAIAPAAEVGAAVAPAPEAATSETPAAPAVSP